MEHFHHPYGIPFILNKQTVIVIASVKWASIYTLGWSPYCYRAARLTLLLLLQVNNFSPNIIHLYMIIYHAIL